MEQNTSAETPSKNLSSETTASGKMEISVMTSTEKKNTIRYDVPDELFGSQIQGAIYLTKAGLKRVFGHFPQRIKVTIEEV